MKLLLVYCESLSIALPWKGLFIICAKIPSILGFGLLSFVVSTHPRFLWPTVNPAYRKLRLTVWSWKEGRSVSIAFRTNSNCPSTILGKWNGYMYCMFREKRGHFFGVTFDYVECATEKQDNGTKAELSMSSPSVRLLSSTQWKENRVPCFADDERHHIHPLTDLTRFILRNDECRK